MNGTRRLSRCGLALLLLLVAAGGPTWALDDGELPRAPRLHGTFRNLDPSFWSASNWTRVRFYLLGFSTMLKPEHAYAPLPRAVPDVAALRGNHHASTVTWVGHSTLLVQLDGVNILTDPTWSLRVGPWSGRLGVRRFTPPGIAFDDLPPIDLVLISHDHYDHLDEATVRRLARAFNPRFVVPLGIKAWLADRGITLASTGGHSSWRASRMMSRRAASPPKSRDSSSILDRSCSPDQARRPAGRG